MIYQTQLRKCGLTWVRARFGLSKIGNQEPYATLTGEEYSSPRMSERTLITFGTIADRLDAAFPELRAFAKWHLCTDGIPMHYIANAKCWHDMANGLRPRTAYDPEPRTTFENHILLGTLDSDRVASELLAMPWAQCEAELRKREPGLRAAWHEVFETLGELVETLDAAPDEGTP